MNAQAVFANMQEKTYYRARDIAEQMEVAREVVQPALQELSRGGLWKESKTVPAWFI